MTKNTGVLPPKIQPTDWKSGADGIIYKEVCQDWTPFLSVYEPQEKNYLATQACVTFSLTNIIETQLKQQGIDINISDRFTAKSSGTTPQGNSLQNVLDSIRNDGWLLEEDYPFDLGNFTWAEYYKEIPLELKAKALQNLSNANWQINYEWTNINNCFPNLEELKVQLKQSPIQRVTSYGSGLCNMEHATMLYRIDNEFVYYFDSYNGGIIKVPNNYPMPWLMKIVVSPKVTPPTIIPPLTKDLRYGQRDIEVKWLQQKLILLGYLSKGLDTGYYFNLTRDAVNRFQWDFKVASPVILFWNRGNLVSSLTRAKLNSL